MDFKLSERQLGVRDAVRALLAGDGGDAGLLERLLRRGLLRRLGNGEEVLEATIVAEELSRAGRLVPGGVQALVAPLLPELTAEPVAIMREGAATPVRFAAVAPLLIVLGEDRAALYRVDPAAARPVASNYVYPVACPSPAGGALALLPAAQVQRRWQLAISAEIVGAMDAAMEKLVGYLSERRQFGQPLGSFQALQHRLSELAVSAECSRILLREAAWRDSDELAASAAVYAVAAARQVCLEAHQLSGARGFTHEFGLYRATMRLQLLSLEAGGGSQHAAVAAMERWSPAPQLVGCTVDDRNAAKPLKAPV